MEGKTTQSQERKTTATTTRLIKAISTAAAIWAIWKIPAAIAGKHLKNIHI